MLYFGVILYSNLIKFVIIVCMLINKGFEMDFKLQNDKDREFYKKDFSKINDLLKVVRKALAENVPVDISNIDYSEFFDDKNMPDITYITLFQSNNKPLRFGSKRENLQKTLQRIIDVIRQNKNFDKFNVKDENICRLMIEYTTEVAPVKYENLHMVSFDENRFEPGINGLKALYKKKNAYYMPTDAIVRSHMTIGKALEFIANRIPDFGDIKDKQKALKEKCKCDECKLFLTKSRAFVTYKDECVPLYRGNTLYDEFDFDTTWKIFQTSADWSIKNMKDDGRFLYYYDCAEDSFKDHEHPTRPLNNLYYNCLRHSGGAIVLIRAYQATKNKKYLKAAKKALKFTISITRKHKTPFGEGMYVFYNQKAKLGGTGIGLVSLMQYRIATGDKCFDKYIKGYARHLLSRIYNGEFLGYYIHPGYHNGEPLETMTEEERKTTFSFYYPGEALLGLALVANHFKSDKKLQALVREKSRAALDWIIHERPKIYANLFTALPSDAWLMQAIEEWASDPDFRDEAYINFVFNDAKEMIKRMYKKDDSPYIDYEGGMYYEHGDHYYPDGARCEGLVAAYYLAKKLGQKELEEEFLTACKLAAHCQYQLYINEKVNYGHLVPEKTAGAIKFKATRQWVRVDSIQHVACFFIRLFWSKEK